MQDIDLTEYKEYIEGLVSKYVDAVIIFVETKEELNNKIAMSLWNSPSEPNLIKLLKVISANEVDNHILALALRGRLKDKPELLNYADHIESPKDFVKHLTLHEIAHIKNNWLQDKETDCDLWAYSETNKSRRIV